MKSINLGFCRCEPRKFNRNIEFAFFNKHGGFRLAIYLHLPIYWYSHKALRKDAKTHLNQY